MAENKDGEELSMIDEIIKIKTEKTGKTEEEILEEWVHQAQANPDDPQVGVYEAMLAEITK